MFLPPPPPPRSSSTATPGTAHHPHDHMLPCPSINRICTCAAAARPDHSVRSVIDGDGCQISACACVRVISLWPSLDCSLAGRLSEFRRLDRRFLVRVGGQACVCFVWLVCLCLSRSCFWFQLFCSTKNLIWSLYILLSPPFPCLFNYCPASLASKCIVFILALDDDPRLPASLTNPA